MYDQARGVGGAIYIGGVNNLISSSIFIDCPSKFLNEAIYFNQNCLNISLRGIGYKGSVLYIDGIKSKIDVVAILDCSYYSQVADEKVNLIPLIFTAITKGGLSYLDNGMLYYCEYKNNEFTFHVTKYFGDFSFTKNYKFKGINDYNAVFHDLVNEKYETSLTLINTVNIYSNPRINEDYNYAITNDIDCFEPLAQYLSNLYECYKDGDSIRSKISMSLGGFQYDNGVTLALNINFAGAVSVRADSVLNMERLHYDIVNINGNGAKVYISSGDHDTNKWAVVGTNKILSVSNLIVEGFNTAIENLNSNGYCILDGVTFNHNRMDYWFDRDYGAAIISTAYVECKNCVFSNNYAKYGGAIYNQGLISLTDCSFINNHGYGKGNDVCNGFGGVAIVNGKTIWDEEGIVAKCTKDITDNCFMDFLYHVFPSLKGDEGIYNKDINLFPKTYYSESVSVVKFLASNNY